MFAPSLTGLAERSASLSPDIDLDTHIDDIVQLLSYWDLHDVVLVGHSYGGMVITGAADRAADRVAKLVYLDAATPRTASRSSTSPGRSSRSRGRSGRWWTGWSWCCSRHRGPERSTGSPMATTWRGWTHG